jgi:tetratricopeptide (TPR) repeat protein
LKPFSRRAPRGTAARLALSLTTLAALCLVATGAEARPRGGGAAQTPAAASPQTQTAGQTPAQPQTQQQQQLSPRERRAMSYAKLLEGQRYYEGVRSGSLPVNYLQRAQEAFQKSAELDPAFAEAHTAVAEISFLLDDFARAEAEGQAAVRSNPDNYGAHRVLSRVYTVRSRLNEGEPDRATADKAVAELREVIRVRPRDAEAQALLAEFYLATGREKEGIEALRQWATLPASVEGRFYQVVTGRELAPDAANARLGEVLLRAGRAAEAVAAIRGAIAIEPDNAAYIQLLGEALEAGGAADQNVIGVLRSVVAQNPQNHAAVSMLARTQARAGHVEEAAETVRAALAALKPGDDAGRVQLQLQLAEVYEGAARYDDAVSVYEELLKSRNIKDTPLASERDREFAVAALSTIANLQQEAGRTQEALAAFDRMRRLLPESDPTADLQKFEFLRTNGRRAEALEVLREVRKRMPDDVRLLRAEANTLVELGRVEEGVGLIRARLKGGADDYEEYLFISSLLINAGRGADAVEAARKALALVPAADSERANNALILISSAQERAGDMKGSEATLRQILAKEPDNATALNNLGYFLVERGERLDEALGMIERAVRKEPANASFLDSLGWAYFKQGKLNQAERYLSDAVRRRPESVAIQEHLGDLFQRLGQKEKAQGYWRKALSLASESADSARIKAKLGEAK